MTTTQPNTLEALQQRRQQLALDTCDTATMAELEDCEAQIAHLIRQQERDTLATVERAQRAHKAAITRRGELFKQMDAMLAPLEKERNDVLREVLGLTAPGQEALNRVYTLARQAYSLAQDLHAITGESRYQRDWLLKSQLRMHASALPHLYLPGVPKPVIAKPWQPLIEEYRALSVKPFI